MRTADHVGGAATDAKGGTVPRKETWRYVSPGWDALLTPRLPVRRATGGCTSHGEVASAASGSPLTPDGRHPTTDSRDYTPATDYSD